MADEKASLNLVVEIVKGRCQLFSVQESEDSRARRDNVLFRGGCRRQEIIGGTADDDTRWRAFRFLIVLREKVIVEV